MKCSVFIATSVDGYIATEDGGIDWLETAGSPEVDLGDDADMGFSSYINRVDCMIMGRKCMEKISGFNLSQEQWPYGNIRIIALSRTINEPPENLRGKVEIYSGKILELIDNLDKNGFKHAYIDGGTTITSFINLELITDLCLTRVPILLGSGIPLFGKLEKQVKLVESYSKTYPNNFIQVRYKVNYQ